ncbi:MAG TPA: bifunctional demethylmenaquinone methyltransferase/2-methoxy-6-polyprenyl-1,4-benzoquinol methylase UbiE [Gammaproteobacteria bacterium]|nr:bifunctional demethylmenaquinone methyltransferase/2-methoxy-6-polyprenyl-1,4-benzoquinol methylase UbiE [Gammaproteobacteria bacterium]
MTKTTHFGFEEVAAEAKAGRVAEVFHSVANRYDLMNDLMSFGVHRLWKRFTLQLCPARTGQIVLDLAGGTGDLALQLRRMVGPAGLVVLADINGSMLAQGRSRMLDEGIANNVEYVQADAEALPFADNSFDCITIAFGLRNVTDKERALASMLRVLKPGGCLLILEFSKPVLPWLEKLYDLYSFNVIPRLGQWVAGDAVSYRYLVESIRMHPDQETLRGMMDAQGYGRTEFFNMTGGVVALHRGYKL